MEEIAWMGDKWGMFVILSFPAQMLTGSARFSRGQGKALRDLKADWLSKICIVVVDDLIYRRFTARRNHRGLG